MFKLYSATKCRLNVQKYIPGTEFKCIRYLDWEFKFAAKIIRDIFSKMSPIPELALKKAKKQVNLADFKHVIVERVMYSVLYDTASLLASMEFFMLISIIVIYFVCRKLLIQIQC